MFRSLTLRAGIGFKFVVETLPAGAVDVLNSPGAVAAAVVGVLQQVARLPGSLNIRTAQEGNTPPEVCLATLGAVFKCERMRGWTVSHRVPRPDLHHALVLGCQSQGSGVQHNLGPGQGTSTAMM